VTYPHTPQPGPRPGPPPGGFRPGPPPEGVRPGPPAPPEQPPAAPAEVAERPPDPAVASTGHPAVDAVLRSLANAAQLAPADQIAEYEAAHRVLQETLTSIDG
jgi:hypothetical protein